MFTLAAGSPPLLMNLLKQNAKLDRFTSSLSICHTKAMTSLAEYGTKQPLKRVLIFTLSSSFCLRLD